MSFIADLHIHSKYSRATAKDMDIASLAKWAKIKGVSMLGTGDFTHPEWLKELKSKLEYTGDGTYHHEDVAFLLSTEVSNIYFKTGRTRRIHNILLARDFNVVEEVNGYLSQFGDLGSDGRPIVHLDCAAMAKELFRISPEIMIIPAHAWTPHFSIFGSNSGFDDPLDCFEEEIGHIYSIETGLSSDPAMNWRWSKLDRFTLTSHSDAHSPQRIGREANVFCDKITYDDLKEILRTKDTKRFLYTIEFFPEEGKYHWDGHRDCKARMAPDEAIRNNLICPICGKRVTVGVMHRLEKLADRPDGYTDKKSPSFKRVVPLQEILSGVLKAGVDSKRVQTEYFSMIKNLGSELGILIERSEEDLRNGSPERVAEAILEMRRGNLEIEPGYDGEYGKVRIKKRETREAELF